MLAVGLAVRLPSVVPWALALLGGEYAGFLYIGGGGRSWPLCAAGFVLLAELAYWSLEPATMHEAGAVLVLRAATVVLTAVAAGALGVLLSSVSNEDLAGGLGFEAAGIGAAIGVLGLVVRLARSRSRVS